MNMLRNSMQSMLRRFGYDRCKKTVGVRALVFDNHQQVLLVKHTYRPGWHTPGGAVDPGESPNDAIVREVLEETGIALLTAPTLFAVYVNSGLNIDDFPILYVARGVEGIPKANDHREIIDVRWFPLQSLPSDTTDKTLRRINEFLGKQCVTSRW
jgi:8-oxo-dGTP pyrophosphatase MutT (NUDIX family)